MPAHPAVHAVVDEVDARAARYTASRPHRTATRRRRLCHPCRPARLFHPGRLFQPFHRFLRDPLCRCPFHRSHRDPPRRLFRLDRPFLPHRHDPRRRPVPPWPAVAPPVPAAAPAPDRTATGRSGAARRAAGAGAARRARRRAAPSRGPATAARPTRSSRHPRPGASTTGPRRRPIRALGDAPKRTDNKSNTKDRKPTGGHLHLVSRPRPPHLENCIVPDASRQPDARSSETAAWRKSHRAPPRRLRPRSLISGQPTRPPRHVRCAPSSSGGKEGASTCTWTRAATLRRPSVTGCPTPTRRSRCPGVTAEPASPRRPARSAPRSSKSAPRAPGTTRSPTGSRLTWSLRPASPLISPRPASGENYCRGCVVSAQLRSLSPARAQSARRHGLRFGSG